MSDVSDPRDPDSASEVRSRHERLSDDVDAILDEIDEVEEENAEEFVRSYVQKGGNGGGYGWGLAEELKQRMSDDDAFKLFDLLERVQVLPRELCYELIAERCGSELARLISEHLADEDISISEFLGNLQNFGYDWRPARWQNPDLDQDPDLDRAISAHRLIRQAKDSLLERAYDHAQRALTEATLADPSIDELISREFGFILRASDDPAGRSAAEWVTSIWAAFADLGAVAVRGERRAVEDLSSTSDDQDPSSPSPPTPAPLSRPGVGSQQLGSSLEEDTLRLLRNLFSIASQAEPAVLDRLRRQTSGTQFGHDIELDIIEFESTTVDNQRVKCHVECKNYTSRIPLSEVAVKLAQEEFRSTQGRDLDHWILISPKASPDNQLNEAVQHWNASRKYPFHVQLWTPDSGIETFFALEPEVYKHYYQHDPPERLSPEERSAIISRWKRKLQPHVRLEAAWVEYLGDFRRQCFQDERGLQDEGAEALEALRKNAVPLYAVNLASSRSAKLLSDVVRTWISSPDATRLLLVGDFGDGKTFFTYSLCRSLTEEFLKDPREGIIPLRIPLSRLRDFSNARELVRARLEEIGVSLPSWERATQNHRTLVFLDGFDELSAVLDTTSISHNVKHLMQCCREFPRSSVLITSRSWFFESGRDRELILPRIGNPEVWRIEPIARLDAARYLEATAANKQTHDKVSILRRLNDPLGLASKPLFLEMIRETLPSLPEERLTEVQLYQQYTNDSLFRKLDDLDRCVLGYAPEELVYALHQILETIAVRLHESGASAVNLRHLGREFDFAELLWQMSSQEHGMDSSEDATQRVGVRSLLRRVPSQNREEWLVDFFHRSVREYYAARGVVSAIDRRSPGDVRLLSDVALRREVEWFACEMIKLHISEERLASLETLAKTCQRGTRLARLGGNCITLLAGVLGQLPGTDWTDLELDYADLTGADLRGVDFSRSSLRYSLLDNANLEHINLTNSDLTGVLLEETADVESVVGQERGVVIAAYADGVVRRWQVMAQRIATDTIAEDVPRPVDAMTVLPNGHLVLACNERLVIYAAGAGGDGRWNVDSAFGLKSDTRIHSMTEDAATAYTEIAAETEILIALTKTVGMPDRRPLLEQVTCSAARPGVILSYGTDNDVRVEWQGDGSSDSKCSFGRSGVTALALPGPEDDDNLLVVTGYRNGEVEMWRVGLKSESVESLWRTRPHLDVVSCLGSTSNFVISGSADRSISVIAMESGAIYRPLQRTVRCKGMVIDGVKGPREREMLAGLLARFSTET